MVEGLSFLVLPTKKPSCSGSSARLSFLLREEEPGAVAVDEEEEAEDGEAEEGEVEEGEVEEEALVEVVVDEEEEEAVRTRLGLSSIVFLFLLLEEVEVTSG